MLSTKEIIRGASLTIRWFPALNVADLVARRGILSDCLSDISYIRKQAPPPDEAKAWDLEVHYHKYVKNYVEVVV